MPDEADASMLERWSQANCCAIRVQAFKSNDRRRMALFKSYPIDDIYELAEERELMRDMDPLGR